jgi:hypothetical protein
VGILKRLRGTAIGRHDAEWQMIYNPEPPCEILQNRLVSFADMQRVRRFARYWDLVGNSGNFVESTPLLWAAGGSPFAAFLRWSDWLFQAAGRTDAIALPRLTEFLFRYLTGPLALDPRATAATLWRDHSRGVARAVPAFLNSFISEEARRAAASGRPPLAPRRQARHLAKPPSRMPEPSSRRHPAAAPDEPPPGH